MATWSVQEKFYFHSYTKFSSICPLACHENSEDSSGKQNLPTALCEFLHSYFMGIA